MGRGDLDQHRCCNRAAPEASAMWDVVKRPAGRLSRPATHRLKSKTMLECAHHRFT